MKIKHEISAGGIVFKKTKDRVLWLTTQHSQHKGWTFPKGLIADHHTDESMADAALREVEEEGGIKARIIKPNTVEVKYIYRWENYLVKKTVHYFLMEYISGDPNDHDWEVSEAKFMTEEEIIKTLTFKSDKEAFEKILMIFK